MKKTCLVAATLCIFAGTASAQSAGALYGVIDQGIAYTKDVVDANHLSAGKNQLEIKSGNLPYSRWGLRGTEDLGAGLAAVFVLESNVTINARNFGQNSLFGRQAFVGIASRDAGTVTLGRQFNAAYDYVTPLTMASGWAGALGSHYNNDDTLYDQQGRRNTLKYASPNYQGFSLGGTVSLGGLPGNISDGLSFSVGAGYANGPLRLGAAYVRNKMSLDDVLVDNLLAQNGVQTLAGKTQVIAAGGDYAFGPAKVGLVYSNTSQSEITPKSESGNDKVKINNIEASLQYRASPALLLGIGYNFTHGKYIEGTSKTHQITLGGQYDLSKRTALYLTASAQRQKDGPRKAMMYGNTASSGDKQLGVRAGIRHSF